LGFAGALGAAGASAFVQNSALLLAISIVLLGIGFWQQRRAKLCSLKRNYLSAVLLWTAVVFVVAMIVFPRKLQDLSPIIFRSREVIKKQLAVGVALIGLLLAVAFLRIDSSTPKGKILSSRSRTRISPRSKPPSTNPRKALG